MACGSIYKIKFPNGKHYIGLTTTSLEQRTKEHKNSAKNGDSQYIIYNAIRKYGMVDKLELIEIDTADTIEELCEKEIGYIIEYNSYYMNENGYNMTYGGEGTNGYVFTEEVRQKMSELKKKYFEDNPEARKEHGERLKKHYEDNPEAREQMSEIMKKYFEDNPEAREQMSELKKKYHQYNPEAGKEHGERMKKYYEDNPEAREQMSEIMKKYFENNPEAIQKCSEAQKKRFENNPEAGKEHGERVKKYYENPEAIQKCSEAQKKRFENPDAREEHSKRLKKHFENNPEAGKEHGERMKQYFENNPEARRKSSDGKGKNKPFDVFTIDGTFIKTFTYQFEAKEYLQTEYKIPSIFNIDAVLAGKRNSSAGFVFKYK
jgi:hypothetical protein